ncbi:hypothetical protein [Streptomyces alanosinicus]|uniref:hypothetical protein n=1 Tax=Streptomyces alanosinicus TaxID=68171 RepID=UPI0016744728|nr:hypothetical protein [Streptomyces alanosinicus]
MPTITTKAKRADEVRVLRPSVSYLPARPSALHTSSRPPLHTAGGFLREEANTAQLLALREAFLNRAVQRLAATGTPVRVGRYTLVKPGQDPAGRLAETQAVVHRLSWQAPITTYDSTGMADPAIRPQMARLYAAICRGEIHGIVAVSRVDISTFPCVYADTLTAIQARGGFLALVRNEIAI